MKKLNGKYLYLKYSSEFLQRNSKIFIPVYVSELFIYEEVKWKLYIYIYNIYECYYHEILK